MSEIGTAILEAIGRTNERLDAIERGVQQQIEGVQRSVREQIEEVQRSVDEVRQEVAAVRTTVEAMPDMHLIGSTVRAQMLQIREMKATMADLAIKLDEIYRAMATDSEIGRLREEVATFRNQNLDLEIRIGAMETRVGMRPLTFE